VSTKKSKYPHRPKDHLKHMEEQSMFTTSNTISQEAQISSAWVRQDSVMEKEYFDIPIRSLLKLCGTVQTQINVLSTISLSAML